MGIEHVTLFSSHIAPDAALQAILRLAPSARVTKAGGTWSDIDVEFSRGFLRKNLRLNIHHDSEYYGPEEWPQQHLGLMGYFSSFPIDDDRGEQAMATLASLRFALSSTFEPELIPDGDERLNLLCDVAHAIGGCLMIPGALLDDKARPLISADGEYDPEAVFPGVPQGQEPAPYLLAAAGAEGEEEDLEPPNAQRVAARALVTAAVVGRGMLEMQLQQGHDVSANLPRLASWIRALGLESECEPEEWQRLNTPAGQLAQQSTIDSIWRLEGLAVLAWSLGLSELPPYDDLANVDHLLPASFFLDEANGRALLSSPRLRPISELEDLGHQLLAVHWRLRDFSIRPRAIDFREFGENCWFGPISIDWATLAEGDLAFGGLPVQALSKDHFSRSLSCAQERHQAINWLRGGSETYSETDTST